MKFLKSNWLLAALLACVLSSIPARADETIPATSQANIFAMLSERGIHSTLQAKDLTAAWRMLRVSAQPEADALLRQMSGRGASGLPGDDLYYTRGDVLPVGGQIYLVAYRVTPPSDPKERQRRLQWIQAWQREENGGNATMMSTEIPPLEENDALALSLISIGNRANLNDIRAFDPDKDLMSAKVKAGQKVKIDRAISQTNLKQVALGMMQYVQDYDELLPPMRAARKAEDWTRANGNSTPTSPVQVMLMPYVKSNVIFLHPTTQRPYLPNYKISRKNISEFDEPAATILFFEDAPDAEGKRNIAFLDGHVKAFSEADFQTMRKEQGISDSGLPPAAATKPKPKLSPPPNKR